MRSYVTLELVGTCTAVISELTKNFIEVSQQESLQGKVMLNAETELSARLMGLVGGTGTRS